MKLRLETQFAAEGLVLKMRWALVAAGALLLLDHLKNPIVLAALGLVAISNFVALKLCKTQESYNESGRKVAQALRYMDALFISLVNISPQLRTEKAFLLAIPILISQAIVCRSRKEVLMLAVAMGVVQAGTLLAFGAKPIQMAWPLGTTIVAALGSLVLASLQSREEMLTSRDRRLASVLECGSELAQSADLRQMILHTLKTAINETKATCGYVMLVDEEDSNVLVTESAYSTDGEFAFPETIEVGSGMSGFVAKMGQPIAISSEGSEQEYDGVTAGIRSAASVPLVSRGYTGAGEASTEQIQGVMTLLDLQNGDAFAADDMELLRTLGALMAVAVSNARMEERRRVTFLRTLESLATALDARDEYTRGHSQRVCEVSLMLGEKMGFGPDALEELRVGTILHDIGKIGVPDAILNKRARLTDEEFEIMKSHPVIGYEICMPLMLSEGVLMIIRNHHEKLDGSGYPDGLKGGELPLSLRLVCVADAFDAMSSRRPYRGVMEMSTVLAELSRCAGTQFDPVVVEALKELLQTERMHDLYRQYWDVPEQKAA